MSLAGWVFSAAVAGARWPLSEQASRPGQGTWGCWLAAGFRSDVGYQGYVLLIIASSGSSVPLCTCNVYFAVQSSLPSCKSLEYHLTCLQAVQL